MGVDLAAMLELLNGKWYFYGGFFLNLSLQIIYWEQESCLIEKKVFCLDSLLLRLTGKHKELLNSACDIHKTKSFEEKSFYLSVLNSINKHIILERITAIIFHTLHIINLFLFSTMMYFALTNNKVDSYHMPKLALGLTILFSLLLILIHFQQPKTKILLDIIKSK